MQRMLGRPRLALAAPPSIPSFIVEAAVYRTVSAPASLRGPSCL